MNDKISSEDLYAQFNQELNLFDRDLLEDIAKLDMEAMQAFIAELDMGPNGDLMMLQALRVKAAKSPADFAEIASGGAWQRAAPHHDLLNDIVVDASFNQRFYIVSLPIRSGKALWENEIVPTPDGWKKMKDVLPGSYVYDEVGRPTKVVARARFEGPLYEVKFNDQTTIVTHSEHEWRVLDKRSLKSWDAARDLEIDSAIPPNWPTWNSSQTSQKKLSHNTIQTIIDNRHIENKSIKDIALKCGVAISTVQKVLMEHRRGIVRDCPGAVTITSLEILERLTADQSEIFYIPNSEALKNTKLHLPIDPWVFGYLLGDGDTKSGARVATHPDERSWTMAEFQRAGMDVKEHSCPGRFGVRGLAAIWRSLLNDGVKHVPEEYLRASSDQRLALLQGLIDSDGSVDNHGSYVFSNTNVNLIRAVEELARSLGLTPRTYERFNRSRNGRLSKPSWDVHISSSIPLARNPTKLARARHQWKREQQGRTIKEIAYIGEGTSYCIQVENSTSLFLAGEAMIPTHNSELVSKFSPGWFISKFPEKHVLLVTHTKSLAINFTTQTRDILLHSGPELFGRQLGPSGKSVEKFGYQDHIGRIVGMGVNGPIIGRGGHLIVCDDPYKDIHQAFSNSYNRKLREWWSGTLRGRLEPGGSIILVLARWGTHDIAGWLLEQARTITGYDPWVEIKIPMVAEEDDILERKPGEVLWPSRYSEDAVAQLKASTSPIVWASQFQQSPLSTENSLFPIDQWGYIKIQDIPQLKAICRYWDLSAGGDRSDYVAGVLMAGDAHGQLYIMDVAHKKFIGNDADIQIERFVREISQNDASKYPTCRFYFEQTPGAGGAVAAHYLRSVFAGLDAEADIKKGSKESNARILSSQQMIGNVYIPIRPSFGPGDEDEYSPPLWAQEFIEELAMFPDVKNDDQVDAASGAYIKLAELLEKATTHGLRIYSPDDVKGQTPIINGNKVGSDLLDKSFLAKQFGYKSNSESKRENRRARLYRSNPRNRRTR